jgi:hypothetical protein
MSKPAWEIDRKGTDYCEVGRHETGTTVCGVCLHHSLEIVADRRRQHPRTEGNYYFSNRFGFRNYFDDTGAPRNRPGQKNS